MHAELNKTNSRQLGMTLIESMVAMTISTVLILGSITMYSQARSNYRTTESVARMQENLRFSIDILDEDVRLAGFWGRLNSNSSLLGQTNVSVTCQGTDVTEWVMQTSTPIAALPQASDLEAEDCRGTNPRKNSDVLIVRHAAATQNVVEKDGVVQIQANGRIGEFFDDGVPPATASLDRKIFDVAFSAYYVSNESKYDTNLPSLRRLSLNGNRIEDQEIIPGVENLQVQFGIDRSGTDKDAAPRIDMYVNDDELLDGDRIISTRLWLLVRSEQDEAGQGYEDNRGPYETPDAGIEAIDPHGDGDAEYPPTYRRMALSRTVFLRNLTN